MSESETRQTNSEKAGKARRVSPKAVAALLLVLILAAASVAVSVIGGDFSLNAVRRTWEIITGAQVAAVFETEPGFDTVFADLGGAVAASGESGIIVYGADGQELARDAFSARNPAVAAGDGVAVAYDVGGRGARIIRSDGEITMLTMENDIVSCVVGGSEGLLAGGQIVAVCTRGSEGYKGQVVFYRLGSVPEEIYRWFSGEGYVLSAAISSKGDSFAVLTITQHGGRVVLLDRDSREPLGEYINIGAIISELAYMKSGALIARSADAIISIAQDGTATVLLAIEGAVLGYSAGGDRFISVFVADSVAEDSAGELITLDDRGREMGRMRASRMPVWLEARGDRLAVLWSDGLDIYSRELMLAVSYPEASGAKYASPRGDVRAVAMGTREGRSFVGQETTVK